MRLKQHVVQGMALYMAGASSDEALKHAQALVRDDVAMAAQALTELGESFRRIGLTLPPTCSLTPWNVILLSRPRAKSLVK